MSDFYANAASTSLRLITEKGQAVLLLRLAHGVFDPVLGKKEVLQEDEYTGQALVLEYNVRDSGRQTEGGTEIRTGDKKVLMAAASLDLVPNESDRLVANGVTYQIINIKTLSPAGTDLLHELQVRR